jgi:hypothetical protein
MYGSMALQDEDAKPFALFSDREMPPPPPLTSSYANKENSAGRYSTRTVLTANTSTSSFNIHNNNNAKVNGMSMEKEVEKSSTKIFKGLFRRSKHSSDKKKAREDRFHQIDEGLDYSGDIQEISSSSFQIPTETKVESAQEGGFNNNFLFLSDSCDFVADSNTSFFDEFKTTSMNTSQDFFGSTSIDFEDSQHNHNNFTTEPFPTFFSQNAPKTPPKYFSTNQHQVVMPPSPPSVAQSDDENQWDNAFTDFNVFTPPRTRTGGTSISNQTSPGDTCLGSDYGGPVDVDDIKPWKPMDQISLADRDRLDSVEDSSVSDDEAFREEYKHPRRLLGGEDASDDESDDSLSFGDNFHFDDVDNVIRKSENTNDSSQRKGEHDDHVSEDRPPSMEKSSSFSSESNLSYQDENSNNNNISNNNTIQKRQELTQKLQNKPDVQQSAPKLTKNLQRFQEFKKSRFLVDTPASTSPTTTSLENKGMNGYSKKSLNDSHENTAFEIQPVQDSNNVTYHQRRRNSGRIDVPSNAFTLNKSHSAVSLPNQSPNDNHSFEEGRAKSMTSYANDSKLTLGLLAKISGMSDLGDGDSSSVHHYGSTYEDGQDEEEDDATEIEKASRRTNEDDIREMIQAQEQNISTLSSSYDTSSSQDVNLVDLDASHDQNPISSPSPFKISVSPIVDKNPTYPSAVDKKQSWPEKDYDLTPQTKETTFSNASYEWNEYATNDVPSDTHNKNHFFDTLEWPSGPEDQVLQQGTKDFEFFSDTRDNSRQNYFPPSVSSFGTDSFTADFSATFSDGFGSRNKPVTVGRKSKSPVNDSTKGFFWRSHPQPSMSLSNIQEAPIPNRASKNANKGNSRSLPNFDSSNHWRQGTSSANQRNSVHKQSAFETVSSMNKSTKSLNISPTFESRRGFSSSTTQNKKNHFSSSSIVPNQNNIPETRENRSPEQKNIIWNDRSFNNRRDYDEDSAVGSTTSHNSSVAHMVSVFEKNKKANKFQSRSVVI